MAITDPFILPKDVVLVPVSDLSAEVREQFQSAESDYAITRPRSRTPSKIVDAETAKLLMEFRASKTIVEAVISYSEASQLNPEETLDEAFPILQRFINARILVPPESDDAHRITACFELGDKIAAFEVLRCIQVLEDTELYQVKTSAGAEAALKIFRPGYAQELERTFEREASVLRHLDGKINPKLLGSGVFEDRKYLAIEWCEGVPATVAAEEWRRQPGGGQKELLRLGHTILEAYAHLHAQKVIHSDIHPRNLLVDSRGAVKLIDFGLARRDGIQSDLGDPPRGGIGFFFEPEFATARLHRRPPPRSTELGEQYALAALLYLLLTGVHYLHFSAEKHEMRRQIAEDSPLPFAPRVGAWPEVEALLQRALSKDPAERFASVSAFATQWSKIELPEERELPATRTARPSLLDHRAGEAWLKEVVQRVELGGSLFSSKGITAPMSSVNYGASGIAYALYRISCIRSDPALLSLADVWAVRSGCYLDNEMAFYNEAIEITPQTVGRIALYHTASGVHAVQALISHALGDMMSTQAAIDAFIEASQAPCDNLDLTLGRSSTLVGCALLLAATAKAEFVNREALLTFGDEVLASIWEELNVTGPIQDGTNIPFLGIAHGWAGMLYAALLWCHSARRALPDSVEERLRQLMACGEPIGRGIRWQVKLRRHTRGLRNNYMSGWCNGSAGYVFLWTLAYRTFHDEAYLALAEKAAWNAWEEAIASDSLCCGLSGGAYGLMNLYQYTGDRRWLYHAQELANRAIAATQSSEFPQSLYKGTMGVAVLVADLLGSEQTCMPLFEEEYTAVNGEKSYQFT